MKDIRMASEKQISFIKKLSTEDTIKYSRETRYCTWRFNLGILLEELSGLEIGKLTMSAASDIISSSLNFRDYLEDYTKESCDEFDEKIKAYAKELRDGTHSYVPKIEIDFSNFDEPTFIFVYSE